MTTHLKLPILSMGSVGSRLESFLVVETPSPKLITDDLEHTKLWHSLREKHVY